MVYCFLFFFYFFIFYFWFYLKFPLSQFLQLSFSAYGPVQLILPCGIVRIRVQIFGYGTTYNNSIAMTAGDIHVISWENGQEELYDTVKEHVVESPNSFLKSAFLFSTLKTTTQVFFFPLLLRLLFLSSPNKPKTKQ